MIPRISVMIVFQDMPLKALAAASDKADYFAIHLAHSKEGRESAGSSTVPLGSPISRRRLRSFELIVRDIEKAAKRKSRHQAIVLFVPGLRLLGELQRRLKITAKVVVHDQLRGVPAAKRSEYFIQLADEQVRQAVPGHPFRIGPRLLNAALDSLPDVRFPEVVIEDGFLSLYKDITTRRETEARMRRLRESRTAKRPSRPKNKNAIQQRVSLETLDHARQEFKRNYKSFQSTEGCGAKVNDIKRIGGKFFCLRCEKFMTSEERPKGLECKKCKAVQRFTENIQLAPGKIGRILISTFLAAYLLAKFPARVRQHDLEIALGVGARSTKAIITACRRAMALIYLSKGESLNDVGLKVVRQRLTDPNERLGIIAEMRFRRDYDGKPEQAFDEIIKYLFLPPQAVNR